MMSGTNRASTTARAISCSKKPMAVAVSISPRNRTTSQPPRLRTIDQKRVVQVRLVEGLHAAELLDVLGGLLLGHVEHVVDGDDADSMPCESVTGQRHAVLVLEDRHRRFLVVRCLERHHAVVHQLRDARGRGGEQELPDPHLVDQPPGVVDHVEDRQRLAVVAVRRTWSSACSTVQSGRTRT